MSDSTALSEQVVAELVRRIVQAVDPRRIILFGSAARDQMGPNSDVDLLVIMPDGVHRRSTARSVYRSLAGMGLSKDIVVVTESDVQRFADEPSLVICPAIKEGKELYRAA